MAFEFIAKRKFGAYDIEKNIQSYDNDIADIQRKKDRLIEMKDFLKNFNV